MEIKDDPVRRALTIVTDAAPLLSKTRKEVVTILASWQGASEETRHLCIKFLKKTLDSDFS